MRPSDAALAIGMVIWMASAGRASEGPLMVRAAVGQAVEVVVEEGVGDLVRAGDPATLKVEHTAGHLFITPMTVMPADLTVIDQQGRSHLLKFVFGLPPQQKIIIKDDAPADGARERQDAAMGLMRQMIRQQLPAGAVTEKIDRVVYHDGKIRLRALRAYASGRLSGYVIVGENMAKETVAVPLQRVMVPGLLAIWSEKDALAPAEKCRVHMVVRR